MFLLNLICKGARSETTSNILGLREKDTYNIAQEKEGQNICRETKEQ